MKTFLSFVALFLLSGTALSQTDPVEFYDKHYDDTIDPFVQLEQAKKLAKAEGKLVLLDVGGEWCIWCRRLDAFFRTNQDVSDYLKKHYVPVKINYSVENKNEEFLGQYPKIGGYPHLFVLDASGTLVHSQNTGELEEGKEHSKEKVMAFLEKWAEERK